MKKNISKVDNKNKNKNEEEKMRTENFPSPKKQQQQQQHCCMSIETTSVAFTDKHQL